MAGRTNSNDLSPSCPSESTSGVDSSSTAAENNILSALDTYTDASSCSCSDFDSVCIHSSDSGFHVSVTSSTDVLSSDSVYLTIHGTNFAERESDNQVTLTPSVGDAVTASVYTSTEDSIVLEFDQLSQLNGGGSLSAEVTSTISSSGTSSGSAIQVAKIIAAIPVVEVSSNTLSSDSAKLTIKGTGFDARYTSENAVDMGSTVRAQTFISTLTSLTMSFTHLSPSDGGSNLGSAVTVQSTWSSLSANVAKVVAANPSVYSSGRTVSSDSAFFTIWGTGFDAMRTTDNSVTLSTAGSGTPQGQAVQSTMTSLLVTFTHLTPESSGTLSAEVVILNTWSSSSTAICKVVAASSATTETVTTTESVVTTESAASSATTETVITTESVVTTESAASSATTETATTEEVDVTTASEDIITVPSDDDSGDESSSSSDDTTVIAVSATIGGVVAILLIVAVYYSACGSSAKKSSLQSARHPRHALDHTTAAPSGGNQENDYLHEL